jgi:hypothetical protein
VLLALLLRISDQNVRGRASARRSSVVAA